MCRGPKEKSCGIHVAGELTEDGRESRIPRTTLHALKSPTQKHSERGILVLYSQYVLRYLFEVNMERK